MRNRGFQVYEQVRGLDEGHHEAEQVHVGAVIPFREVSHFEVVGYEDVHAFEYGPVLDDGVLRVRDFEYVLESLCEEINFEVE